jgi:hypothetical protein
VEVFLPASTRGCYVVLEAFSKLLLPRKHFASPLATGKHDYGKSFMYFAQEKEFNIKMLAIDFRTSVIT